MVASQRRELEEVAARMRGEEAPRVKYLACAGEEELSGQLD
jgi:hypothetical protein